MVNNNKHVIWWSFANLYEDGSWEAGSFMVGHDHLGYAIFSNDKGEVRVTTDIEGRPGTRRAATSSSRRGSSSRERKSGNSCPTPRAR